MDLILNCYHTTAQIIFLFNTQLTGSDSLINEAIFLLTLSHTLLTMVCMPPTETYCPVIEEL